MRFYPGKELGDDPSNWWGPNIQCIIDMLKSVGFKKVTVFIRYIAKYPNAEDHRVIIKAIK